MKSTPTPLVLKNRVKISHGSLSLIEYRRIRDMLRPHFLGANHKHVYRLYSAAV
ncbi:hypothetical protein ACSFBI_33040 [Variovorax sp. RB3P1]|jgi:hypothetical protein|uniref:hypothetical protein n=1 Tax=Variovorax sp. RB3P1 TaxID=3443732 RepID=UPI003F46FCB8